MKRSLCKRDEFTLLASHKLINELNKKKKTKIRMLNASLNCRVLLLLGFSS